MSQDLIYKPGNKVGHTVNNSFATPAADIWHDREGYTLEVEMPGVNKESVEVSIEDGKLVVIGRLQLSQKQPTTETKSPYPSEIGGYRRVFDLSPEVDVFNVKARMADGLLTLRILKSESIKPRKITVE